MNSSSDTRPTGCEADLVQPAFAAVLIMLLLNEPRGYCVLKVLRHVTFVVNASLFTWFC